mgnify:CR=1 FL=1
MLAAFDRCTTFNRASFLTICRPLPLSHLVDFVRSVDAIYKSIRLLAANIRNSSQIDMAVEGIINTIFYIVLGSFVLGQLGVNPLQLFFSLSSVILAFAFMFSNSSSKYFEGMLFILVQRPYGKSVEHA